MTTRRRLIAVVLLALSCSTANLVPRARADEAISNKITLTSENLDSVLFANNPDVVRAMNAVMKAKDQVAIARAGILPSLSINLALVISNPPAFVANSMSCLVPFLFPSNWFEYAASKHNASAEVMAFHITKLNVYSQALALTTQVGGDTEVYLDQTLVYDRLKEYVEGLQLQAELGVIPATDVMKAQIELNNHAMELSKLRQLIDEERAAIRKLFGFSIEQDFAIQMATVPPSPFESQSVSEALPYILARAPERRQIDMLIAAAQSQVRAAQWAFLGGCQGNQGSFAIGGGSSAFTVSTGFSINIGFGYYPRIQLARRNVQDMILRQHELELELGRVLEVSKTDIQEISARMATAEENRKIAERLLAEEKQLLPLGRVSVKEMLDTYAAISSAQAEGLASRVALDGHRVTLKRVALEDGFLKVFIDSRRQMELSPR